MSRRAPTLRGRRSSAGVALLMVIASITILALVLIEFSGSARTHLSAGTNIRDDIRAQTAADTAMVLTRACLDPTAWGPMASMQSKLDLEKLCDMMLKIFTEGRLDLPIGGLSMELEGLEGTGMEKGVIEHFELRPEASFIGLAGLLCPGQRNNCEVQRSTIRMLRTVLCNPRINYIFDREQADGKSYTRADIIANLIDWMDPDDTRVQVDIFTGQVQDDLGEGEDSYYRDVQGDRYRSKDAPLDSIEELRLIRGINDELFFFLQNRVSVHASGKIDFNTASVQTIATILKSMNDRLTVLDGNSGEECADNSDERYAVEAQIERYAQLVVEARTMKSAFAMLGNAVKSADNAKQLVSDPVKVISPYIMMQSNQPDPTAAALQYLERKGWTLQDYTLAQQFGAAAANGFASLVKTESNLYRLRARARVGNITRTVFAVLKRDGKIIRTLYYREE